MKKLSIGQLIVRVIIAVMVVILFILGTNAVQLYFKHQDSQLIEEKNTTTSNEIKAHIVSIDSLNNIIQKKINALIELDEDVEELEAIKFQLTDLVESNKKKIISLRYSKRKLENYVIWYEEILSNRKK